MDTPFDPASKLQDIKTKQGTVPYLAVKWRVVWLRDQHPGAHIETAMIEHEPGAYAIFRAYVSIPDHGSATGWARETQAAFTDYVEKAETVALGRALANLGYGMTWSADEDDHDAETVRHNRNGGQVAGKQNAAQGQSKAATAAGEPTPITAAAKTGAVDGKMAYLRQEAKTAGVSADDLEAEAMRRFQVNLSEINDEQRIDLVSWCKSRRDAVGR